MILAMKVSLILIGFTVFCFRHPSHNIYNTAFSKRGTGNKFIKVKPV